LLTKEVVVMTETEQHTIVVGIDGSPASKSALAWAVYEARLRGSTVTAVQAWQFPVMAFEGYGATSVPVLTPTDLEKLAEQTARDTVTEVLGDDLSVPVVVSVRNGHAASVLVDAGAGADLLVVGSEGHGGFAGMLLGSVSSHVLHHATCPVAVVRPGWTPPAQ
jgi:nucleotide-binding universal stress UspA family protein